MFGLLQRDIDAIVKCVREFPEITKVLIFGSRALGNFKEASDIDIAISTFPLDPKIAPRLRGILNDEMPIPYFIDVVDIGYLQNKELLQHIKEHGVELKL